MNYLISEDQINALQNAVAQLPVQVNGFETADRWVGLFLALGRLRERPAANPEPDPGEKGE